ncbi:hypothetical protein GCM10010466_12510 [Planomonospora alba]|uniref:DUF1440 domain-containing protein n=1 Tax=Planomonospora alba TaxID=161354 RepID=A0ABP6MR49_9ACTN
MWIRAVVHGMLAGAAGAAAMTLAEKLEQRLTGRPSSYVPARTLERLTGLPESPGRQPDSLNLVMHLGQGCLLGALRGVMAAAGLRGPWASGMFFVVRLTNDQVLENATGVGAPPWTWPRGELLVDLLHKAVYAFATGAVADRLARRQGPGPGQVHAGLRPGRVGDVGPPPREHAARPG